MKTLYRQKVFDVNCGNFSIFNFLKILLVFRAVKMDKSACNMVLKGFFLIFAVLLFVTTVTSFIEEKKCYLLCLLTQDIVCMQPLNYAILIFFFNYRSYLVKKINISLSKAADCRAIT